MSNIVKLAAGAVAVVIVAVAAGLWAGNAVGDPAATSVAAGDEPPLELPALQMPSIGALSET